METLTLHASATYDRQALVVIYQNHSDELFRYAYRMLGDKNLAEDCVADTFSRFLQKLKDGRNKVRDPRPYLFRMAHNWITDHYRRQPPPAVSIDLAQHGEVEANPSNLFSKNMVKEAVRAALMELPADQRMVIELRFLQEWSHEQVASALERSVEATRALQYRALNSLRQTLMAQEVQPNG
jgi:RNA polymerase sigma-70 factor (ECF subfamily)